MKYEIIQNKKGEKDVYGIFRPEGMDFGKNGIRRKLCSGDELLFKHTKAGKRKRSQREQDLFLRKLWEQKLKEIVEGKESNTGIGFKKAAQLFLDTKAIDIKPQSLEKYTAAFNRYIQHVGDHSLKLYKPYFRTLLINGLREKNGLHSNTSINTTITFINALYSWCYDNE